jgi:hypothetical protein
MPRVCLPEMKQRLGYRLRITSSDVSPEVRVDGRLSVNVEMINDGWLLRTIHERSS